MTKNILTLICLMIFTSACSVYHVKSEDISTDYHPSKRSVTEVVYVEDIVQPHEIIGFVTVNTERAQRISEVIEKMKREAAILGGDAITGIKSDATGTWKSLPAQELVGNAYVRANFTASVLVFK